MFFWAIHFLECFFSISNYIGSMNVDWTRINSFITEGDEEEMQWLREMIQTLIDNYEERLKELDTLTKNPDNSQLVSLLHQMKGVASNFGLDNLWRLTQEAELLLKAGNLDATLKETQKFSPIWQETKNELKTKLNI